jgi:hypothetical protein
MAKMDVFTPLSEPYICQILSELDLFFCPCFVVTLIYYGKQFLKADVLK